MTQESWSPVTLMPGWEDRLERATGPVPPARRLAVARATVPLAARRVFVTDAAAAERMVNLITASPIAAIAVDSEFRYRQPEITLRSGYRWQDRHSVVPLLVSLSVWLTSDAGDAVATYVLDVRVPEVVVALGEVLRLPVPLVAHYIQAELFTFWALGLDPDLDRIHDTHVAAAVIDLGRSDGPVRAARAANSEEIAEERALAARRDGALSLIGLCRRYGVSHPFAHAKEALRMSFLDHPEAAPFSNEQVAYAASDADATLQVYAAQGADIARGGHTKYLETVEFPFTVANAAIEWAGVPLDHRATRRVREACQRVAAGLTTELAAEGIANPHSRAQILGALEDAGLGPDLSRFARGGRVRIDDEVLKHLKTRHRVPALVLRYRHYNRLASEEWLAGLLTSEDGRLRPAHGQLRTRTGRNNCARPNMAGVPAELRPLVKAPPGRAIVELDYGQVEVAVAAAEHRDTAMIAAYNSEDVYAAMAQRFFKAQLTDDERTMDTAAFKAARPALRKKMKIFVLAVMFNMTAKTIAAKYGLTLQDATDSRQRFLETFPSARDGLAASAIYGLARGYAYIRSGPRRYVNWGPGMCWKAKNAMINTPIQGAAAIVFKIAVIALYRHFRGTSARVILPMHDAVLIECDATDAERVVAEARFIMKMALRSIYPAIQPKVDDSSSTPGCWNKDGDDRSVERFLVNAGILERDCSLDEFWTRHCLG